MNKISLGKSNLKIAPLIFGGNVFGWTVNEKIAFELLDEFVANGLIVLILQTFILFG